MPKVPRMANGARTDAAQLKVAMTFLLTQPGIPFIYYGDEIGMRDVPIPADRVQDPAEKQQPGLGLGRDPERTPMQWSAEPNGGFTTGVPWLPVAADVQQVNVASEGADSSSTLALYQRLLELREEEPALSRGTFRMLPRQGDVLAFVRQDASRGRYLVLVNVGAKPATFALTRATVRQLTDAGKRTSTPVAGTHARASGSGSADAMTLDRVSLAANEAVIIALMAH